MIVGVIGAGQMGAGIAQVSAGAGHDVLLSDIDIARELTPTDVQGMEGNADAKIQNDVGGQIYYLALNQKVEERVLAEQFAA